MKSTIKLMLSSIIALTTLCSVSIVMAKADGHKAPSNKILKEGQKVYNNHCVVCHGSGVAGAPKMGDNKAWQPRVKQGIGTLVKHVDKGYKFMPPKGTCVKCDKEQLKAAVEYMVTGSEKKAKS